MPMKHYTGQDDRPGAAWGLCNVQRCFSSLLSTRFSLHLLSGAAGTVIHRFRTTKKMQLSKVCLATARPYTGGSSTVVSCTCGILHHPLEKEQVLLLLWSQAGLCNHIPDPVPRELPKDSHPPSEVMGMQDYAPTSTFVALCPCRMIIMDKGSHCDISLAACTGHWVVKQPSPPVNNSRYCLCGVSPDIPQQSFLYSHCSCPVTTWIQYGAGKTQVGLQAALCIS